MTEERRTLIQRIALVLAWVSALYGCLLLVDSIGTNDTAGWVFFLVPIVLVVGERITRGDDEDEDEDKAEADGPGTDSHS
jgi:hypothetical protein